MTLLRYGFALIAAAATLEVTARVDDAIAYGAPLLGPYNPDILYTNDELGKCGRPFARYVKWQFNSLGYRSPEVDPEKFRIITIGASETFGLYESKDREYPRVIESELNRRAGRPAYQVVNVAYPGLSNTTALRRMPVILKGVRPQVAVLYPSLANYITLPSDPNHIPMADPVNPYEVRLMGKTKTVLKEVLPVALQTALRDWEIEREMSRVQPIDRVPEENIAFFRRELQQILDRLIASGVTPVLVTHATRFGDRVTPEERPALVAWRKFYPALAEDGFLDMERRLNQVIRDEAAARGLKVADAARRMPAGPRYFADFVHLSDEGAQVMGEIIGETLYPLVEQMRASAAK